jgi:hypothetical protein
MNSNCLSLCSFLQHDRRNVGSHDAKNIRTMETGQRIPSLVPAKPMPARRSNSSAATVCALTAPAAVAGPVACFVACAAARAWLVPDGSACCTLLLFHSISFAAESCR